MAVLFSARPHVASAASAPRYEFFGCLVRILAGGEETGGSYSLSEHLLPAGAGTPPHVHHNEDEAFYILAGEVTIWCGGNSYLARAGDFAMLPRGVRHSFLNTGAGDARMLVLTNPAGFEQFIAEAGAPTEREDAPPMPEDTELGRIMTEIAPKYGIELLVYV
jgi:mannose-6-phosphate isomerase-like protein (cupin superfamily)